MPINAQAPISYGGAMLSYGIQADLTTVAAAFRDLRYNTLDAFPTNARARKAQSNLGHSNDAEATAFGIIHGAHRPDALQFTLPLTCADVLDVTAPVIRPPLMDFLRSAGWNVQVATGSTTIAVYTSAVLWTLTADIFGGADAEGVGCLVELNDGTYWPTILRDYTFATMTCVPCMGLPSASSAGNAVRPLWTATPHLGPIDPAKSLSFMVRTRAQTYTYTGCALSGLPDIVVAPNGDMSLQLTFHVGEVEVGAAALAAEDFQQSLEEQLWQGLQLQFDDADDAAAIANEDLIVQKATWKIPYTCKPRPGVGSVDCLNDIQGYVCDRPTQADDGSGVTVEVVATLDTDRRVDFLARTEKYIAAHRAISALGQPAFCVVTPACYSTAEPEDMNDDTEAGVITQTNTFQSRSARWEGTGDALEVGNRDVWIGLGGEVNP